MPQQDIFTEHFGITASGLHFAERYLDKSSSKQVLTESIRAKSTKSFEKHGGYSGGYQ
jgi:hypothetical protein